MKNKTICDRFYHPRETLQDLKRNISAVSLEIMQQLYIVPVGHLNVELTKHSTYGGRVGSDFLSAIAGRVDVSPSRVGSGRVGRVRGKRPVDNSGTFRVGL